MSEGNTITPNGGSKELYTINEDVGKQQVLVADVAEKDPHKDLTGNIIGDNTDSEKNIIIDNTEAIRDFGSVTIRTTFVGEPIISGPDTSSKIKVSIEEVKNAMKSKGALTAEEYIQLKKDKLEKELNSSKEDEEKVFDDIDDRN